MQQTRFPSGWWLILFFIVAGLVYWRARETGHIWELIGIVALAIGLLAFGSTAFSSRSEGSFWGCFSMIWGLAVAGLIVYFLVTGDYWRALEMVGIRPTPTPIVVTATPEVIAVAPVVTAPPAASVAPASPTALQTPVPPAPDEPRAAAWWQANPVYAQPLTPEIEQWRVYGLVIIVAQYLILLWARARMRERFQAGYIVNLIFGVLLTFTIIGEWLYRIFLWLFSLGVVGKIILVLLGGSTGMAGVGNLSALIIGGYIYPDRNVLLYMLLPSIVVSSLMLAIVVWRVLKRRDL